MDVTGCPVTNAGIKGLCSNDYAGYETDYETRRMGQCKLIHTLKMKKTKIGKEGIKVALENLTKLKIFEFYRSVQILAEIRRDNLERGYFKTYSITKFECTKFMDDLFGNILPYESRSLRLAATLCPFVNVVHITLQPGLTDFELCGLLELKVGGLRELKIEDHVVGDREWENNEITFDCGVLPLLKAFGSSLVSLTLYELNICVNIRAIVELCPHLEHLILQSVDFYSIASLREESNHHRKDVSLKHLKKLRVVSEFWGSTDFSSEMLSIVLSSPGLVSLEFFGCDAVTDDVLEEAARLHEFQKLELLDFSCCDNVTKKGIDFILNERNPLRSLCVNYCSMIRQWEFDEWNNKAREENWEIEFNFEADSESEPESDSDVEFVNDSDDMDVIDFD